MKTLRFKDHGYAPAAAFALLLIVGCDSMYPPKQRPKGVPPHAAWVGGIDGGGYVVCMADEKAYNECTIWNDYGGEGLARRYVLRGLNRPAKANELKYEYLAGKQIGLENGLLLVSSGEYRIVDSKD
jgi:hypothetical protein